MPAIFFALISYLGWGIGDIFGTIATRRIGPYSTTFWYLALSLLIYAPFALLFRDFLKNLTTELFIINVILGMIGLVGLLAFYEGLRIGNASLIGTIAASFTVVTVILSIIFLKETLTLSQIIAITVIFLGLVISTLDFKELQRGKMITAKGVLLAVIAMLMWGIYWTFIKIPVRQLGWYWPGIISTATFPLVLIFLKYRKIKLEKPTSEKAFGPLLLNALLLGAAAFSFNIAIDIGLTAIVAPIAGSYPTLFVLLAFLIFKDPITRQQILGIVITLIGIVALSIISS